LIQLYAKGDWIGFQFADSYLQNELEFFIYEDTPDQTKSTQEVKPIWKAITYGIVGLW
jgi:transcription-repair coupling factor (superfamily II helicase)